MIVEVLGISGSRVRLGITADKQTKVVRANIKGPVFISDYVKELLARKEFKNESETRTSRIGDASTAVPSAPDRTPKSVGSPK